jgi:hypothetical protein
MKASLWPYVVACVLTTGLAAPALHAEDGKALPTLLIKGEVVSLDTNDPTATLLKVKDRYGFETPIYVTPETQVQQGQASIPLANLATGSTVEVEYNFDVNTAKRHAVSVKVQPPAPAAEAMTAPVEVAPAPAAPSAEPPAEAPAPAAPAPVEPAAPATP